MAHMTSNGKRPAPAPSLSARLAEMQAMAQRLQALTDDQQTGGDLAARYRTCITKADKAAKAVTKAQEDRAGTLRDLGDARSALVAWLEHWKAVGVGHGDLAAACGLNQGSIRAMLLKGGEQPEGDQVEQMPAGAEWEPEPMPVAEVGGFGEPAPASEPEPMYMAT